MLRYTIIHNESSKFGYICSFLFIWIISNFISYFFTFNLLEPILADLYPNAWKIPHQNFAYFTLNFSVLSFIFIVIFTSLYRSTSRLNLLKVKPFIVWFGIIGGLSQAGQLSSSFRSIPGLENPRDYYQIIILLLIIIAITIFVTIAILKNIQDKRSLRTHQIAAADPMDRSGPNHTTATCEKCRGLVGSEDKFCQHCGASLKEEGKSIFLTLIVVAVFIIVIGAAASYFSQSM